MNDLVEFLRARLDEDERLWREQGSGQRRNGKTFAMRMLVDVEGKRRIIDAHARPHECIALTGSGVLPDDYPGGRRGEPWELWEPAHTEDHGPCFVLRCLALPYASHPDHRSEWRP